MNHLSDKDLDRLSKEAAEQYDVQQNTSGWDQLHRKLNKELPVQGKEKRRRFLFLLLFFAILTGGGMVYSYLNSPTPKIENFQAQESVSKSSENISRENAPDTKKTADRVSADSEIVSDNRKPTELAVTPDSKQTDPPVKLPDAKSKTANNNPTSGTANKVDKSKERKTAVGQADKRVIQRKLTSDQKNIKGKSSGTVGSKLRSNDRQPQTGNKSAIPVSVNQKRSDEKNNVIDDKEKNTHEPVTGKIEPATVNKKEPYKEEPVLIESKTPEKQVATSEKVAKQAKATVRKNYPFSISAVAGPDLSNVNFRFNDKPGFNAGLRFSWQFAPRFSLSTGAVYTKKNYSALGRDYNPPKGYWTNYVTIDKVTGSCWMIDIPLEVRYDMHAGKTSKWFISSGLSTYLMDKEDYEYHYMYNGAYTVRRWINNKNSDYILSIANLSAGYEKMVGRHTSIQAEPYLKIPLKGVGFGKMQMNSYGLNLSVRYGFSMMKKKVTTTSP